MPGDLGVLDGLPEQRAGGRIHPQDLLERRVEHRVVSQGVEGDLIVGVCDGLLAKGVLPLPVSAELVDEHRDGDGTGVMRGHQQEDHVVDDVGVGEPFTVLVATTAQHREEVRPVPGPTVGQLAAEVAFEPFPGPQSTRPGSTRHVGPHDGLPAEDRGVEVRGQLVGLRADRRAHEDLGGLVQ